MNQIEFVRFQELEYACKEAINSLCVNLSFSANKKILITSAREHEGKSFLTMNMMRTLAQLGKRVVLIDADLRRSQVKAKYGMRMVSGQGYGLAHYLAGMSELDDVIYSTNFKGAYVIPIGHEVSNSLALLNSPRLKQLLNRLAAEFDFVLVDAPPAGAIVDPVEISKHCDAAVIAVKYNHVSRKELVEVRDMLERAGCMVLGAVLNEVSMDSISSKKYYNKYTFSHYDSEYYKAPKAKRDAPRSDASRPFGAEKKSEGAPTRKPRM